MSMAYYRGMLTQRTRVEAFQRHIPSIVQPGDVVLEIGSGLGTYAFFAADSGAARVWAVEGAPVVNVAKAVARINEYGDRVRFIRGWFPGVVIPEPVDVLIFEDYPSRLLDPWTYDVLKHVHHHVLKPGARVLPDRASLYVAPVHSERIWEVVGAFGGATDVAYGIDWLPSREYICNTPLHMPIARRDLCHEPQSIAHVQLTPLPRAADLAGEATWTFAYPATIHGVAYWFDLHVGDGTWLSNAPESDPGSWGYLYLPIPEPLTLGAGDTLSVLVAPETTTDQAPSWLTWEVRSGSERFRGHEFRSFPASLTDVVPSSPSWVPALTPEARLELQILAMADGNRSVDEIAGVIRGTDATWDLDEARRVVFATLRGRTTTTADTTT